MSSILTQREREGLEDVFSSIHSKNCNYFKEMLSGILSRRKSFTKVKFFKQSQLHVKKLYIMSKRGRKKH